MPRAEDATGCGTLEVGPLALFRRRPSKSYYGRVPVEVSSTMTESSSPRKQLLGSIGGIFLGVVFLVAVGAKAVDPGGLVDQIQLEGLDFLFAATTVTLIALALETGLGVALLLGVRNLSILIPTSLLVVFFLGLTGRNYWLVAQGHRDPADCGCFGSLIERTPAEAFWQDLLLLLPALLLAFWHRPGMGRRLPKARLGIAAVVAMGTVAWVARHPDLPFLEAVVEFRTIGKKAVFNVSPNFRLTSSGKEIPGSRVYESDDSAVFLITSPNLEEPLILDPTKRSVAELSPSRLVLLDENRARLQEGRISPSEIPYEVGPEGIVFSLDQREFLLARMVGKEG